MPTEQTRDYPWSAHHMALAAALLPCLLFPVTYLIAASQGHIDWCIPIVSGCTDITHTGLRYPESHLFRIVLCVGSLAIAATWALVFEWTKLQGVSITRRDRRIRIQGVTAGLGLFVGTIVLQGPENTLWSVHGIGANLYFLLAYIAVVSYTRRLREIGTDAEMASARSLQLKRTLVWAMTLMIVLVIAFRILGWRGARRSIQWLAAYSFMIYYLSLAYDWRGRFFVGWRTSLNDGR
ncbi:MAG: hypothetical protein ACR2QU_00805 [Gammaproteobacteria bacterium]